MAKNTKQSNQKKSVLNKLGGLSKRSKFIVVVLIFAVLGGGYLTYKSFAATATIPPIKTYAQDLDFDKFYSGCTSNKVQDPAKNNMVVMQISCPPGQAGWKVQDRSSIKGTVYWPPGTYKVCVMAKGVGHITVTDYTSNLNVFGKQSDVYINSPDYKEYCNTATNFYRTAQRFNTESGGFGSYDGHLPRGPVLLTISSITRYWYAPGVASAPNGK